MRGKGARKAEKRIVGAFRLGAYAQGPLATPTLVWGGPRGGISVALALSRPDSPIRVVILAATYAVVLFAVIVQGGSIGWPIERIKTRRIKDGGRGLA